MKKRRFISWYTKAYSLYHCENCVLRLLPKAIFLILCVSLFLIMSYGLVIAAEDVDTKTSTVTLTIVPVCQLGIVDEAVSEAIVMDSTGEATFDAGYVEFAAGKPTLTVNVNKNWKLTAKSSGFTGPYEKPIGDLMLKDNGSSHATMSEFTSLSERDQEVASHTEGVHNESHPCQYKIDLDWEKDIPGTYEATVTYTLSASGS